MEKMREEKSYGAGRFSSSIYSVIFLSVKTKDKDRKYVYNPNLVPYYFVIKLHGNRNERPGTRDKIGSY